MWKFLGWYLASYPSSKWLPIEVSIPEQSGLKKKYQIHLKSTESQIYVRLAIKDLDKEHPGIYINILNVYFNLPVCPSFCRNGRNSDFSHFPEVPILSTVLEFF